ncbi:MAG: SPOR domain-containing protein [Pseudomonadota bacterium]
MARDYGQRGGGNRRQARGKGGGAGLPGWVWLTAGLSAGLAVAAFVYISRPPAEKAVVEVPADKPAAKAANRNAPIPLPPKEKARFTFYEILRDQEVVIPREQTRSAQPPAGAAADNGRYVVQVASFRSEVEAERQKANLALLGIESRIESVTIDNKDTYYRVRVGPESWSRVQTTIARLEENGIDALVIKLQ